MQKNPIGIQDFEKLIKGGFVYVDKTPFIHRLANEAGIYFLSNNSNAKLHPKEEFEL